MTNERATTGIPELLDLSFRKNVHVITQPPLLLNPLGIAVWLGRCRLDSEKLSTQNKWRWRLKGCIRVAQSPCAFWKIGSIARPVCRMLSGLAVLESPDGVWLILERGGLLFAQAAKERVPQRH